MMPDIKSRPTYTPLKIDPTGRRHLLVCELTELPDNVIENPTNAALEIWLSAAVNLQENLTHRLHAATIGLRLYGVGTETFLWDVHNIATNAGLGKGEIFLTHAGSLRRRVYCTHCKTIHENVTTSIVTCSACGANLFVRDHFSRRLAAFMGVAIDAETPGAVPPAELLYP